MDYQHIYDLTLPIKPGMTVYPKNPEVDIDTFSTGQTWISKITFGSHTGTHFDAPRHVKKSDTSVDQLNLNTLIGPCRVLDASAEPESVSLDFVQQANVQPGERILFKTSNSDRGFDTFYDDYVYLSGDAADYLAEKKVGLIAIDYLSIKQRGSDDTRPHDSLLNHHIPIIEAVNLKGIQPGDYHLIALPLKLQDLDGAPARVVLLK